MYNDNLLSYNVTYKLNVTKGYAMQLIVVKVGQWKKGNHPHPKTNVIPDIKRIVLKSLDDDDKRSFYLNLDSNYPDNVHQWEPYLVKGNILDVSLMVNDGSKVKNDTTINKYDGFKIVRDVTKEQ